MTNPYATGVLQKETHAAIVANLAHYARDAGIQERWISTPAKSVCSDEELDYMRKFKRYLRDGDPAGLCLIGSSSLASPESRCAAMAGCLVRNFVRARVMTLGAVLEYIKDPGTSEISCLLIPNLFVSKTEGGALPDWKVGQLLDLLMQRQVNGVQTVIHVSDKDKLAHEYGTVFARFISNNYLIAG